jgi:hypothetical protein
MLKKVDMNKCFKFSVARLLLTEDLSRVAHRLHQWSALYFILKINIGEVETLSIADSTLEPKRVIAAYIY